MYINTLHFLTYITHWILERVKNRNTWRKTPEVQERSTTRTLSHEYHAELGFFSGERHNSLTKNTSNYFHINANSDGRADICPSVSKLYMRFIQKDKTRIWCKNVFWVISFISTFYLKGST